MRVVFLLVLPLLFSLTPAFAEPGFSEKYERESSTRSINTVPTIR
jgi:hypothetical protein